MPLEILSISQASKYFSGYAGEKKKDDRLLPIICWAVCRYNEDDPDEVVGQVWDGACITEANEVSGAGFFVGYFIDDAEGRKQFAQACNAAREDGIEEEEDDDEEGEEDEDEDEEDEDEDDEDEEDEEEGEDDE
jgi:hypothetical protein